VVKGSRACRPDDPPLHEWGYMYEKSGERDSRSWDTADAHKKAAWEKADERFQRKGLFVSKNCQDLQNERVTEAIKQFSEMQLSAEMHLPSDIKNIILKMSHSPYSIDHEFKSLLTWCALPQFADACNVKFWKDIAATSFLKWKPSSPDATGTNWGPLALTLRVAATEDEGASVLDSIMEAYYQDEYAPMAPNDWRRGLGEEGFGMALYGALDEGYKNNVRKILERAQQHPDRMPPDFLSWALFKILDARIFFPSAGRQTLKNAWLTDLVKMLMSAPNLDVNWRNSFGKTPLLEAINTRNDDAFDLLIEHKNIDVGKPDLVGTTPLLKAIETGNGHVFDLLIEHENVDVGMCDPDGNTPLAVAAKALRFKFVKRLLDLRPESVNILNDRGESPLRQVFSQYQQIITNLCAKKTVIELLQAPKLTLDPQTRRAAIAFACQEINRDGGYVDLFADQLDDTSQTRRDENKEVVAACWLILKRFLPLLSENVEIMTSKTSS